jgi:hypothetical protein
MDISLKFADLQSDRPKSILNTHKIHLFQLVMELFHSLGTQIPDEPKKSYLNQKRRQRQQIVI